MEQIGDYIVEKLKSPQAALNTVNKIQDTVDRLAETPLIGAPLSSVHDIETDYRFLVCENYLVFYRVQGNDVFIDRILYGRRNYIAMLFGEIPQDETD